MYLYVFIYFIFLYTTKKNWPNGTPLRPKTLHNGLYMKRTINVTSLTFFTICPIPSRHALTLSSHVITCGVIFASTFLPTIRAISPRLTS